MTQPRRCKDCPPEGPLRPTPHPGPRCSTHHRAKLKAIKSAAHGRRLQQNFGITTALYWAIYEYQGGTCAICRIATGATKHLAVDHDHELALEHDHPVEQACQRCIRGLLCGRCNRWGVPLFWEALIRAVNYLADPPARKVLAGA